MKGTSTVHKTNGLMVVTARQHNPAVVFLSGQTPGTRYAYMMDLRGISNLLGYPDPLTCPWGALRFQHTQAIRTVLTEFVSPYTGKGLAFVTINKKLSALRGVLKTAWRLGQMDAENYYRAIDVDCIQRSTLAAGRELTDEEITRLMNVCSMDLRAMGVRDGAIIALMSSCGLRRNEVSSLNLTDYEPLTGKLKVSGKRRKERTAYLVNEAALAIADWIRARGSWEGPLFTSSNGGFHESTCELVRRRISNQAIYNMLARRGRQAGIPKFSPHDLRRTFVSHLLEAGVDISTVSKMCGHANVATTMRYDHRPEATKRKAAALLHVKYKRRSQPHRD